jgi:hypothetical protein
VPPEAALRPGRRDALALLVVWFVRKSSFWVLWLGIIVAIAGRADTIDLGIHSPDSVLDRLVSPLAGVVLAVLLRLAAAAAGLVLAYPLARAREVELAPRTYRGASVGILLDRLHVARAYRSLRWTHHVRQLAILRLGVTGRRLSRLDPIMDAANVGLLMVIPVLASAMSADIILST